MKLTAIFKFNPYHDELGRFAPKDRDAQASDAFILDQWKDLGMMEAKKKWREELSREERDKAGNARSSIRRRVKEIVGIRKIPDTGDFNADLSQYMDKFSDILPSASKKLAVKMTTDLRDDLLAAGVGEKEAREFAFLAADHLVAQDYEAAGRTLGDHGVHHLNGNIELSKKILSVIPGNNNTPRSRLLMSIAGIFHDTGYLTPPSRAWLDDDHPRWSTQYFTSVIGPKVRKMLGRDFAEDAASIIFAHDFTGINFEREPEISAFSIADNMALFHKEKMPPMLRHVPSNVGVLVRLAEKKISVEDAQAEMAKNIDGANLSIRYKARFKDAVKEVSGVLPKFTLGMLGATLDNVEWKGGHLAVSIRQRPSNEALMKVLDLGQRQFSKLAETYHQEPDTLAKNGSMIFSENGKPLLEVTIRKK